MVNFSQIKLVQVQDNRFVSRGYNLSTFEKPKRSELYNFVGDNKSQDDGIESRSYSVSNLKQNNRKLSEFSSLERLNT